MNQETEYLKGDATQPKTTGDKIIVHICNDIGGWGKGFVMAISKRWEAPEIQYREWYKSSEDFNLGAVQFVQVESDLWVANMIGQHKVYADKSGNPPIRYQAVETCLKKVAEFAQPLNASVHMPRIGCGLAGGTWDKVEPIIADTLVKAKLQVFVYDF